MNDTMRLAIAITLMLADFALGVHLTDRFASCWPALIAVFAFVVGSGWAVRKGWI
jgi:hypothetical protein